MDSKTKRLTIVCMLCVVLVIAAVMVMVNFEQLQKATGADTQEVAEQGTVIEEDGKVSGANLSAFMNDETFFDQEESTYEGSEESNEKELSLLVTSVEKDLRIKVVDSQGNAVEGYEFCVLLEDKGEYRDTDQDGMIYIDQLKPGRYQISLEEIEGFQIPKEPLEVRVKAIVSYTTIADISYLVHEESEVDVSKEDTQAAGEEDIDSDDSQYTTLLEEDTLADPVQLGIDVSKWNGEIDWELVKAEGVDFAIIRCGYRGSSSGWLIEDPYFFKNLAGAKKAGIQVGIYFFTQAISTVEAVEEASMVVSLLGEETIDYPIFIDTEGAGGSGRADSLDVNTRTMVCNAFCKTIQNAGYQAGIYASRNWYYNNLQVDELSGYKIWLAEYTQTPLYEGRYDMWQYTSSGSVAGIEGRVDLNVSYQ